MEISMAKKLADAQNFELGKEYENMTEIIKLMDDIKTVHTNNTEAVSNVVGLNELRDDIKTPESAKVSEFCTNVCEDNSVVIERVIK